MNMAENCRNLVHLGLHVVRFIRVDERGFDFLAVMTELRSLYLDIIGGWTKRFRVNFQRLVIGICTSNTRLTVGRHLTVYKSHNLFVFSTFTPIWTCRLASFARF